MLCGRSLLHPMLAVMSCTYPTYCHICSVGFLLCACRDPGVWWLEGTAGKGVAACSKQLLVQPFVKVSCRCFRRMPQSSSLSLFVLAGLVKVFRNFVNTQTHKYIVFCTTQCILHTDLSESYLHEQPK